MFCNVSSVFTQNFTSPRSVNIPAPFSTATSRTNIYFTQSSHLTILTNNQTAGLTPSFSQFITFSSHYKFHVASEFLFHPSKIYSCDTKIVLDTKFPPFPSVHCIVKIHILFSVNSLSKCFYSASDSIFKTPPPPFPDYRQCKSDRFFWPKRNRLFRLKRGCMATKQRLD